MSDGGRGLGALGPRWDYSKCREEVSHPAEGPAEENLKGREGEERETETGEGRRGRQREQE